MGVLSSNYLTHGLVASGSHAYCVRDYTLRIFDVSNAASPSYVTSFALGGSGTTNPWTQRPIAIVGSIAYVVVPGTLYILDLSSPTSPSILGSLSATGCCGNSIAVQGQKAYSVSDADEQLSVIDVSNSASPSIMSSVTSTAFFGNGVNGLSVKGNFVYATSRSNNAFAIIDVSDPASPFIASGTSTRDLFFGVSLLCLTHFAPTPTFHRS